MTKLIKSAVFLFMCFAISSCSQNKVDALLDNFEKVIVKWEQKIEKDGRLSKEDYDQMGKEFEKLAEDQKSAGVEEKEFSTEQKQRLQQLSLRMAGAALQGMPKITFGE